MDKIIVSEKMGVQKEWYKRARETNLDELPEFLKELMENYSHDYGTVCHAIASGAIATMWAMNKHESGGITGFQAGCILWEVIRHWSYENNKTGMKIVDYDKFLYPQYEDNFDKTISKSTWEALKKEAQKNLQEADEKYQKYLADVEQYKIDIAEYLKKYPDYYENRSKYDRLGCGTGAEWEAYYNKKKEGFEFAPTEPFEPLNEKSKVYLHRKSIVNDIVPFGYRVVKD